MFMAPITITYDDGSKVTAHPKPIDTLKLERKRDENLGAIESTLFLGWSALSRSGEGRGFDEWAAVVADIEIEADAVDPTNPAQPTDSPPS